MKAMASSTGKNTNSVTEKLKNARRKKGITFAEITNEIKINKETIQAIESGEIKAKMHSTYLYGLVKSYADLLGFNGAKFAQLYMDEIRPENSKLLFSRTFKPLKALVTSKIAAGILAIGLLGISLVYIVWQFVSLASAPKLEVAYPPKDLIVKSTTITIKGRTSEGSEVFINDSPVLTDPDGSFTVEIFLNPGVNELNISAINALSKKASLERVVIAEYPTD